MASRNLITDVAGIRVGNAHDAHLRSGVTVLLPDERMLGAVDIRGGGPGTRDTGALTLAGTVNECHGLVLAGGSAFGLSAATGVQSFLRDKGAGFRVGEAIVPIVPGAILFDLLNGGDKKWGRTPPYEELALRAAESASDTFEIGSAGAGYGATTALHKGGLGSASRLLDNGVTVGALAAVNAAGSVTIGAGPHFWAAPLEIGEEFGGLGWPRDMPADAHLPRLKSSPLESTTLGVVATDANLSKAEAYRLAVMAQTGLARAIYPVHTPLDGDIVFAFSTGDKALGDPIHDLSVLGAAAANVLARAIARAVYLAGGFGTEWPDPPSHRRRFG